MTIALVCKGDFRFLPDKNIAGRTFTHPHVYERNLNSGGWLQGALSGYLFVLLKLELWIDSHLITQARAASWAESKEAPM